MNYNELLQMPEWHAKRQEILSRDFKRCRNCGSKEGLQVHHRQYHCFANGDKVTPWTYESKYLITLCVGCHQNGHKAFKVPVFKLATTNQTTETNSHNQLVTQL
jgi:5-methylcytosine-specific restriction endonuclease McrA